MKLVRCENGHFYDQDKFAACPHCQGTGTGGATQSEELTRGMDVSAGDDMPTSPFLTGNSPISSTNISQIQQNIQQSSMVNSSQDDGKTVAYFNYNKEQERQAEDKKQAVHPVVGWLVCISGTCYGKSFNLYSGRNFIGRTADNDVSLTGDNTVSRSKHATIIYEPKMRQFYAQTGEARELFYLNDAVVLASEVLKDRDVITIGQTQLVFVPFCDDAYGWEREEK